MTIHEYHTIVLGSGAAGLNAAVQLKRHRVDDLLILTEGLKKGTSINTGSDKQTYYKLGLYGDGSDSPGEMAKTLFEGGSMDGDTALVEAALSARAFYHLCDLGVPFPQDAWGQYPGYKTDHDPRQRATSIGPYTSREMCQTLIDEVNRLEIPVRENRVAVKLLKIGSGGQSRIAGVVCIKTTPNTASNPEQCVEVYLCDNLVFATGGPGGLYRDSVYPNVHLGGIGLALEIGATAQNLSEAQFGLASTAFRWNVSGSYMQVIPRFFSCEKDGTSDCREFLDEYFDTPAQRDGAVFLKGYQWPFDVRKISGSSLIDIAVYRETVERGRRVFLDYRCNSPHLDFESLDAEVLNYLEKSRAIQVTPIKRLEKMNMPAVELYRDHGIDIATQPLEIALCAQHNNGGLAVGRFWESVNIAHLFVAGEVAGTHGVARPGGSALNSGQVSGFRIAEFISGRYQNKSLDYAAAKEAAEEVFETIKNGILADWRSERVKIQARMSDFAGAIVEKQNLESVKNEAVDEYFRLMSNDVESNRIEPSTPFDWAESLRTQTLAFASLVYLSALYGSWITGSRGSRLILDESGEEVNERIPWKYLEENEDYRELVHELKITNETSSGGVSSLELLHDFRPRRPIPPSDAWFETAWTAFRNGEHLTE